jgi:predicted outer membrane repeat protein
MSVRIRTVSMALTALLCSALSSSAAAAATDVTCSPFVPHTRSVGNMSSDASCTDDTLQAAIDNTVCPNTTIFVTQEHSYSAVHLNVQDKSITLSGTTASCAGVGGTRPADTTAATPTAPVVTLDGTGNGGQSVLTIRGSSNVTLQFLELTHGSGASGSHGGGVDFNGTGSLTLDTSTIDSNSANFGGGIEINGNGGAATLTLKPNSLILSNTATANGGGINIEGTAQLLAVQPSTLIGFNHAPSGKGGGVAVVAPARADIGSPGLGTLGVIYGNDAAMGGGLSAQAVDTSQPDGFINLFSTDPLQPVAVESNFAAQGGGAIYLKPVMDFGGAVARVYACAEDFRLDDNAAPEGAAIFSDFDKNLLGSGPVGVDVHLNHSVCGATPGAVHCAAGTACNTLNGNLARDAANHPTAGSVVFIHYSDGSTSLNRFAMRNSSGAHAIRTISASPVISECLLADNDFSAETLRFEDDGNGGGVDMNFCTIANNTHNSGSIVHTEVGLDLTRSILDQPAMSSLNVGGTPSVTAHFVLATDPTGLPASADIIQGEPIFADAANGNYRLQVFSIGAVVTASLGVDAAPLLSGQTQDLDGNPRDQDVPAVPNVSGVGDFGAYEAQPILDRIFADAFGDAISLVQ